MSRTRTRSANASPTAARPAETAVPDQFPPDRHPSTAAAIAGIRQFGELQREGIRFATECARKNAGMLASFAACRTPVEFLELWRRTAIDAVTDYVDEAERLLVRTRE